MTFPGQCRDHPWYQGIYRSKRDCSTCHNIYYANHGQTIEPIPVWDTPETAEKKFNVIGRILRALGW